VGVRKRESRRLTGMPVILLGSSECSMAKGDTVDDEKDMYRGEVGRLEKLPRGEGRIFELGMKKGGIHLNKHH